jgi:voltage-gated potassium channel
MPDAVGGSHMASLIANPDVMEFLDTIRVRVDSEANVETISYSELPSSLRGKTIAELESRQITGATIVGFKSTEGEYLINPPMETVVNEGSKLFVLGNLEQIQKLIIHFKLKRE